MADAPRCVRFFCFLIQGCEANGRTMFAPTFWCYGLLCRKIAALFADLHLLRDRAPRPHKPSSAGLEPALYLSLRSVLGARLWLAMLIPHLNVAFHCILYLVVCCCLFCHFILRFCAILLLFLAVLTLKTLSYAPFLFNLYFLYLSNENLQNRKV